MKKSEVFPSKYLKEEDLDDAPLVVTIVGAPLELLKSPEGKEQKKTVLYFSETKKMLPLNVTNWDAVANICGDDSDDWPGKKIELYPTMTSMAGKTVPCIRVRKPAPKIKKPAPLPTVATVLAEPEFADSLEDTL